MPQTNSQQTNNTQFAQSQTLPANNQQVNNNVANQSAKEEPILGNAGPGPKLPSTQQGGREEEIVGGLRNALERGSDLQKAKQSFLNAGYTQDEVEKAVQMVPNVSSKISKPLNEDNKSSVKEPKQKKVRQKKEKPARGSEKNASRGLVVALIVMVILLIAGAGVTYFFWDKLF